MSNFNLMNTSATTFDSSSVVVPLATNGTILELPLNGMPFVISAELTNLGANAFDAFLIEARVHPDAAWFTYLDATALAAGGVPIADRFVYGTGAPGTLAAAAVATMIFQGAALDSIRFRASNATAAGTAQIRGTSTVLA